MICATTTTTLHPLGLGRLSKREAVTKYCLDGAVIWNDGSGSELKRGFVIIERDSVTFSGEPPKDVPSVTTDGLIVPGLVDIHNHAPFAVFPAWRPTARMEGRFDWRGKTRCGEVVNPYPDPSYHRTVAEPFRSVAPKLLPEMIQFGLLRAAIGGTTSMVVDADLTNQHFENSRYKTLFAEPKPRLRGLLDVSCLEGEALRDLANELEKKESTTRLLVHLGEGFDEFSRTEFSVLRRKGLLTSRTVLIHGLGLSYEDWEIANEAKAKAIWSPASHLNLYGRTLSPRVLRDFKEMFALAPDWTITGSPTLLDELAVARRHVDLSPGELLRMATAIPAGHIGQETLGRLGQGSVADFFVLRTKGALSTIEEAEAAVVHAGVEEVSLVVSRGQPVFGTIDLVGKLTSMHGPAEEFSLPTPLGRQPRAVFARAFVAEPDKDGRPLRDLSARLSQGAREAGCELAPLWESPPPVAPDEFELDLSLRRRRVSSESYWKLADMEKHLNGLQHEYRKTAMLWLAAFVGATGWILKEFPRPPSCSDVTRWPLVALVALAAMSGLLAMWHLDLRLYHQLLRACVRIGEELERQDHALPPMHLRWREKISSARAPPAFFYSLGLVTCGVVWSYAAAASVPVLRSRWGLVEPLGPSGPRWAVVAFLLPVAMIGWIGYRARRPDR